MLAQVLMYGAGLAVIGWVVYTLVTRLFAKQLVLRYLNNFGIPLEKYIKVQDETLWYQMVKSGSMGLGEGYMFRWYTSDRLEELMTALVRSPLFQVARPRWRLEELMFNMQSLRLSLRVAYNHYDIGNDLYSAMLGRTMCYTCGWWENVREGDLDTAQDQKMEMLCKKMNLQPGMRVLDIGTGFGSLQAYMKEHYNCDSVGLSLSQEQKEEGVKRWPFLDIRILDYRSFFTDPANTGTFDRVVSVGMFEHVGYKNYDAFFRGCRKVLKPDGLLVLHTIGVYDSFDNTDAWLDKYIFPGVSLPSVASIGRATENVFTMENWINIGPYYSTTLCNWRERAMEWFKSTDCPPKYDQVFQRMWYFYLTFCAVMFREREIQLWQIVFSKSHKFPVDKPGNLQVEKTFPVYGVQGPSKK
jgi:cyclopropane-fatty-acyl-phospholipid synthase